MNQTSGRPSPERGRHLWDEPDIGSGEKSPGQKETEEIIRQIPPLPERQQRDQPEPRNKDEDAAVPPPGQRRQAAGLTAP